MLNLNLSVPCFYNNNLIDFNIELKPINNKNAAIINLDKVDVKIILNSNPIAIPHKLPKLIKLNFKGERSAGFIFNISIIRLLQLLQVLWHLGMGS